MCQENIMRLKKKSKILKFCGIYCIKTWAKIETKFFSCKLNTANKNSVPKKLNKIDQCLSQNVLLAIRKSQDSCKIRNKQNIEPIRDQNPIK